MDKKKFSELSLSINIPPRLVKAQQGWYFVFYVKNPSTGLTERVRKSYNLNRIKDKRKRKERANDIFEILEELMPLGYPYIDGYCQYDFEEFSKAVRKSGEHIETVKERTVEEAVTQIVTYKIRNTTRKETERTYSSRAKLFLSFLAKKKWNSLPLSQFSYKHVQEYLDEVRMRVSNTTYENYRKQTNGLFLEMIKREWIDKNPFAKAEKLKRGKKRRRPFTEEEAVVCLTWAFENDWWLFVLILLHLGGWMRRTECYRLRFRDFNLTDGYIVISDEVSKNKKSAIVTIPAEILFFFRDDRFSKHNPSWLLFGSLCHPHPTKNAGESTWKTKHRNMLIRLHKCGLLSDIQGLSLYSWKDTGVSLLVRQLAPIDLRDHARHSSLEETMKYYHAPIISEPVKQAHFGLFDTIINAQIKNNKPD